MALATLALAAHSADLRGQDAAPAVTGWAIGVAVSTPLLADGNGTRVRSGVAPMLAARMELPWPHTGRLRPVAVARGAVGALQLGDRGERWSGGTLWQGDLLVGAAWEGAPLFLIGALGGSMLHASRRVTPLERTRVAPAAEAALRVRIGSQPWVAELTVQGLRLSAPGGSPGGVARFMAGVGRAF